MRLGTALVFLLLLWSNLGAEPFPYTYTEPAGTAFAETFIYSCCLNNTSTGKCQVWQLKVCTPNQNGTTAEVINGSFNVPIRADELPKACRQTVTTRNSDGNETAPGVVLLSTDPHVFNAP